MTRQTAKALACEECGVRAGPWSGVQKWPNGRVLCYKCTPEWKARERAAKEHPSWVDSCGACGAQYGEPCRGRNGPMTRTHKYRRGSP